MSFRLSFNGKLGVEKAREVRPDIILMDVIMPEMGGFEACREIRSHKETKSIPVILITTRGEEENLAEGYAAGCNDYMTKPIDKHELAQKMQDLLD